MKPGFYSLFYFLISDIAIILCFVPFLLLLWKKIKVEKVYFIIGIYWLTNGLINIPTWFGQSGNYQLSDQLIHIYNLINTPIVLLIFFFGFSGVTRKITLYTLVSFILFELIVLIKWKGYNSDSGTMITGAGLLLVFIYSIAGVVQYLQKMEHTSSETALVFSYAALLFAYGGFIIIYIFHHIVAYTSNNKDSFLLYYISLFLAALITTLGLWTYAKPVSNL